MAATAPKIATLALLLAFNAPHLRADDTADVHQVIASIATALSSDNAALAMDSFKKSYADYGRLSNYFEALSTAYAVESQLQFTDEDIQTSTAIITVHWTLNLSTRQTAFNTNREADIMIRLTRDRKHWKITSFAPIAIFDPQE